MSSPPDPEKRLSPLEKQLLVDLRAAGAVGLEPRDLKYRGGPEGLRRLAELGLATELEGEIFLAAEAFRRLRDALLQGLGPGDRLTIAASRQRTGLTRKYLLPLLNRLEADGHMRRLEEDREVVRGGES